MLGLKRHHFNTAIYLGVSILSKGASVVLLIPVYSKFLTPSEYGDNGLCQTLYSLLPPLLSLALAASLGRFFFDDRDPARRDQTVGTIAAALITMCLGVGLLLELVLDLVPGIHLYELRPLHLRFVLWTCVCTPIADIPSYYFRASERAERFAALNLSTFVVMMLASLYLVAVRKLGLVGVLGGVMAGQIVGASVGLVFTLGFLRPAGVATSLASTIRAALPPVGAAALLLGGASAYLTATGRLALSPSLRALLGGVGAALGASLVAGAALLRPFRVPPLVRSALRFSIPYIPHMIGNALIVAIDRWAIKAYHLNDEVGFYTYAAQLTLPVVLAASAWNEATAPRFFATWRDGGYPAARAALPRILAGFLLIGSAALGAVMVALPIFKRLVNAHFDAAYPYIPWIGLTLVVGSTFSAFVSVLEYRKLTKLIPFLTLSAAGANVLLNLIFIPRYGVYGAILATGLAYLLRVAILAVFALRALRPDGFAGAPPVEAAT